MSQSVLFALVFVLFHAVVKFSIYWKRLDLCDDFVCRFALAIAIVLMLGGSVDIAMEYSRHGSGTLLLGVIIFFAGISRRQSGDRRASTRGL